MSLLQRGTETVTVYPEEVITDSEGSRRTRPSAVGVVCKAVVQPIGTPTEEQAVGFQSVSKYRLRLVGYPSLLGAQAQVEWQGKRYAVEGEPVQFTGSRRTAHVDYVLVRRLPLSRLRVVILVVFDESKPFDVVRGSGGLPDRGFRPLLRRLAVRAFASDRKHQEMKQGPICGVRRIRRYRFPASEALRSGFTAQPCLKNLQPVRLLVGHDGPFHTH
jgi:hypothetical protein